MKAGIRSLKGRVKPRQISTSENSADLKDPLLDPFENLRFIFTSIYGDFTDHWSKPKAPTMFDTVRDRFRTEPHQVNEQLNVILRKSELLDFTGERAKFRAGNGDIDVTATAIEWTPGRDRNIVKKFTFEDAQMMALHAAQAGMGSVELTGSKAEKKLLQRAIELQNKHLPENQKIEISNPLLGQLARHHLSKISPSDVGYNSFKRFMDVGSSEIHSSFTRPPVQAEPATAPEVPPAQATPPITVPAQAQVPAADAPSNNSGVATSPPVHGESSDVASPSGSAASAPLPDAAEPPSGGPVVPAPLADVAEPPSGVTNVAPAGVGSEEPDASAPSTVSGAEIGAADPAVAVSGPAADDASRAEKSDEEVELSYAETQAHLEEYRALIEPQLNDLRRMGEFKDGDPIDSTQNDNSHVYRTYQSASNENGSITFEILYTLNPEKTDLKIVRMHDTNDPNGLVSAGVYRDPEIVVKSDEGHKLHPKHAEWRQAVAEEFGEIAEHTPTATFIPVVKTKAEVPIDASNSAYEPASAGALASTSPEHIALTTPPAEEKALGEPILPKAVISDHEATDKIISEMQRRLENSPDARDPRFLTGEKTLDHSRDVYAVAYNPSGEGRDISLSYIFDNEKPILIRLFDPADPQGQKSIYSYRDPKTAIAGDIFHPIAMKSASQESDSANGQQFNGAAQAVAHEAHAPICKPMPDDLMRWPQPATIEVRRPSADLN